MGITVEATIEDKSTNQITKDVDNTLTQETAIWNSY